eukprot:11170205-Alexandrium_andersonii.AAC.1
MDFARGDEVFWAASQGASRGDGSLFAHGVAAMASVTSIAVALKLRSQRRPIPRDAADSVSRARSLHAKHPPPLPLPECRQRMQCNKNVSAHTSDAKHRRPALPTATPPVHYTDHAGQHERICPRRCTTHFNPTPVSENARSPTTRTWQTQSKLSPRRTWSLHSMHHPPLPHPLCRQRMQ